jgi:hypothetical protein
MANVFTRAGMAIVTNRIIGAGTEPKFIGVGTSSTAASQADTALGTEDYSTTNDTTHNLRITGTSSRVTTAQTNDTYQSVGTFTAAHSTAVNEAGLFDSNGQATNLTTAPSGGNMLMHAVFSTVNLSTGDTLSLTLGVQFT